jgi:hypothetical protein
MMKESMLNYYVIRYLSVRLLVFYEVYGGKGHAGYDLVTQTKLDNNKLVS